MKMFIPKIGDRIVLTKGWSFDLRDEYRNDTLYRFLGGTPAQYNRQNTYFHVNAFLPENTVLSIDRVYVRTGRGEYNSVTFSVKKAPFPFRGKLRFWARLEDVNKIEFEMYEDK